MKRTPAEHRNIEPEVRRVVQRGFSIVITRTEIFREADDLAAAFTTQIGVGAQVETLVVNKVLEQYIQLQESLASASGSTNAATVRLDFREETDSTQQEVQELEWERHGARD